MIRLGFKHAVHHGDLRLGELVTIPVNDKNFQFPSSEIRIHHLSQASERCPPLSILQTISSFSVICKLESPSPVEQPHLINLHASCFYELKTAVVLLPGEEIHLVAMPSKQKKFPCFWCCLAPPRLYDSCLGMLNLRCLAIVFDLDETLIVANTTKSFEDRIEALKCWITRELDPVRMSGMAAELQRYVDDRALLRQYTETDTVTDNGKDFKVQYEEVPPMLDGQERVVRPVIRLPEKNVVFTRINPENRDTSVLVRLRPTWEDLMSYLIAKGRKRFEVYVCTMAERDYALEMWRLLDPAAHLIGSKQLMDRVICVKSGSKKSLLHVFQGGLCHPKMAMVIDDRLKVWEDKDQPRVHVVPPFTPYYAPQAEAANAVPVLCVARNVACNVRGGFFKEFDENSLRKISELFYEDEVGILPPSPDVGNYLMSEDAGFMAHGITNAPLLEGLNGAEAERRLGQLDEKNSLDSSTQSTANVPEKRSEIPWQPSVSATGIRSAASSRTVLPSPKPSLLGAPGRRDGASVELDPDSKRRLLIMKHGQDLRTQSSSDPPLLPRFPSLTPAASVQPQGGQLNSRASGFAQDCDLMKTGRKKVQQSILGHVAPLPAQSTFTSHAHQMKGEESCTENEKLKQNIWVTSQPLELGSSQNQASSNNREIQAETGRSNPVPSLSIGVVQEIGRRCGSKVEFKSVVSTSKDLQFSVEVLFTGEKIGVGMGKTRKDAQQQAADNALHSLADKYKAFMAAPRGGAVDRDFDKLSIGNENGFVWDVANPSSGDTQSEDGAPTQSIASKASEVAVGSTNHHVQKRASSPIPSPMIAVKLLKKDVVHDPPASSSSSTAQPKNDSIE